MYSIELKGYTKVFKSIWELVDDVVMSGIDPHVWITRDGKRTNERVEDLIVE